MAINTKKALTLPELLVAVAIFVLAFAGIVVSYIACLDLNEISKNSSIAVHAVKDRIEEIKNRPFDQIKAIYHNVSFTTAGLNGKGISYVDDSSPCLLLITVSFSWRQRNGRIIGEDLNLNGQLNAGEDKNNNGMLDSLVEVATRIFKREVCP